MYADRLEATKAGLRVLHARANAFIDKKKIANTLTCLPTETAAPNLLGSNEVERTTLSASPCP